MTTKNSPDRARLIKLIHVARRELGMDDESYREMLKNMRPLGGKTSAADLSITGLHMVLEALKSKGFKVRSKGKKQPSRALASDAQSRRIRSLWLELHDEGVVRDPSEAALASYVCRITKIEALQWLSSHQAAAVIETLKKWLERTTEREVKNVEL
jgi:phage gp16-like protein